MTQIPRFESILIHTMKIRFSSNLDSISIHFYVRVHFFLKEKKSYLVLTIKETLSVGTLTIGNEQWLFIVGFSEVNVLYACDIVYKLYCFSTVKTVIERLHETLYISVSYSVSFNILSDFYFILISRCNY